MGNSCPFPVYQDLALFSTVVIALVVYVEKLP
jgi:hypothetical protein